MKPNLVYIRVNIILLALVFLVQLSVYAQDNQRYGQGGNAPVRGTTPTGPRISGPNIQGPNIQGPNIQGPNIQGPNIQGPNIQGPNIQGPNIQGPNIQGPNIVTPDIPSPLWLSPAQQAMMQPAGEQPAQQPANQQPAAQQPAGEQPAGEYIPGEGATVFDENGVPIFYPPQEFPPPSPAAPPPPEPPSPPPSPAGPPGPSFPAIPPPSGGYTAGVVNDICSSDNACDDCPDFNWQNELTQIKDFTFGKFWGFIAGKDKVGFTAEVIRTGGIDSLLDSLEKSSFAIRYGFLAGLAAADCDPDVYAELYKKMQERAEKAQKKQEQRDRDQFNPCVPSGGGGSHGGGPPC